MPGRSRFPLWPIPAGVIGLTGAIGLTGVKLLVYAALARFALSQALCQWDCAWYLSIVQHGYDAAPHQVGGLWQANWAYFPMYPLLVRGVDALTGLDPKAAGALASTACFVAFALLGVRYRRITRGEASPWPWLLFVCAWPFGFYFHAQYTEALYAALATAVLLALADGRPLLAGLASMVVTATRPTGILLAAWIGFDRLWHARRAKGPWHLARLLLPAALAPLGLLGFMAFLYVRLGDPLAFVHIMAGWNRTARNPLLVLTDMLMTFDPAHPRGGPFYLVGWAVLGLAASGFLLIRRRFAEAWICGMTVLLALSSGTLGSVPRYVAANPVFLFAAADLGDRIARPWPRAALLLGMAALQAVLLVFWYRGAAFLL